MQAKRTDFEKGFALLKIPYSKEPTDRFNHESADAFKRASVLTDSNVGYAANSYETSVKR